MPKNLNLKTDMSSEVRNPGLETNHATDPAGLNLTRVLYRGYPDAGLEAHTAILTQNGFKQASKIQIDDVLISGDGRPVKISAISTHEADEIYTVEFKSGRMLKTGAGALWAPRQDAHGNIESVVTTKSLYERLQKTKTRTLIFMPVNAPVDYQNNIHISPETAWRRLCGLGRYNFKSAIPDEYLYAGVKTRQAVVKYFAKNFATPRETWVFHVKSCWNTDIAVQLELILRSLGYNLTEIEPKHVDDMLGIRVYTQDDLRNPNAKPVPTTKPINFRDEIVAIRKLDMTAPTVCIAPEPGVYNYIVEDFCIMHTTLYSYHFEGSKPVIPWAITREV